MDYVMDCLLNEKYKVVQQKILSVMDILSCWSLQTCLLALSHVESDTRLICQLSCQLGSLEECYDETCLKVPKTLDLDLDLILQYMQYMEVCIGLVFKLFCSQVTFVCSGHSEW